MPSFAIIVPCYNEEKRLQHQTFIDFAQQNDDVQFFFIDDGSTDNTKEVLLEIQQRTASNVIALPKNFGKGEAVRQGLLAALGHSFTFIGYLDADLSTSLDEFYQLQEFAAQKDADLVFASRIKKMDSKIKRSMARHLIGRTIATIIDRRFKLGVYDTQCGAKIFRPSIVDTILNQPFHTKWFFDVEILLRLRKRWNKYNAFEVPLTNWQNVKNSKINLLSFPDVLKELWVLSRKY